MPEQTATAYTYAKLFPEQLANPCRPDAPESNTGPIAYLHALYYKALELEGTSKSGNRITLAARRPDIVELVLDPQRLEQPVSALTLAIRTLARHAQERAGESVYLPEAMASAGQHACLPFHRAHEQTQAVLKHWQIPHLELLQKTGERYPSFCYKRLRTDELRQDMRNASGFSPALQTLLLDETPLRNTGDDWRKWYGMAEVEPKKAIASLLDVETYGRRTGLRFEQILEMLAVAGIDDNADAGYSLVHMSKAYRPASQPEIDKYHYGATYINARRKKPLTIKDANTNTGVKAQFGDLDYDCLSRMYQIIHLQRALGLPFAEVDLLLMSILRAEGQVGNWHLTPATLRAIGVFRYLNEAYEIKAEQFAALMCEVNPFGIGEQVPMLDRILDGLSASGLDAPEPLAIDDRAFDPTDQAKGQFQVVPTLAKVLGTDEPTTLFYLDKAKQALGVKGLTLSLKLLSSLYRLSRMHRLFKRSPQEGKALIALLGTTGADVWSHLAGTPVISDADSSDTLDTLVALSNLDQWLRRQEVSPSRLLEALSPIPTGQVALDSTLLAVIREHRGSIENVLKEKVSLGANDAAPVSEKEPGNFSAQQEQVATILTAMFGTPQNGIGLSTEHVPALVSWSGSDLATVLKAAITVTDPSSIASSKECLAATRCWLGLIRCCALSLLLRLSSGMIQALNDSPDVFDLEQDSNQALSLDLCYQFSRLRDWIQVCRGNGKDEKDAITYLADYGPHRLSTDSAELRAAAKALNALIGWSEDEVLEACPHVSMDTVVTDARPTFDDFLKEVTQEDRVAFENHKIEDFFRFFVVRYTGAYTYKDKALQLLVDKLRAFMERHPGPLLVTAKQYKQAYQPAVWIEHWKGVQADENEKVKRGYFPIAFEALADKPQTVHRSVSAASVPSTVSDIDLVLRLKEFSEKTGLACTSLLNFRALNETSAYLAYEGTSQLFLATLNASSSETVDTRVRECWRDALAGYLIAHWAPPQPDAVASVTSFDDLSSYCLCDIAIGSQVNTTLLNQAIGSLQHYLFRLLAHLEPGYATAPSAQSQKEWHSVLGQYNTWKRLMDEYNHPANLIHYANRPRKSVAFQELEVELNQGKMDTDLLHTAICGYLTKFERVSNLQVISGYLDSHDPKSGMYHFIAKTNTTPYEYYWRTFDISMRDEQERINPLAWSEWEKISLATTDPIAQNSHHDVIRPVVIAGRRYVFWVERGTTDLPDGKNANKTMAGKRKFSMNYAFQQSDGAWSTANELLSLDGYDRDGVWHNTNDSKNPNNFVKSEDYKPGLIVIVNQEGVRRNDPWLVALMYDSNKSSGTGLVKDADYYLEARDLLLLRSQSTSDIEGELVKSLLASYKDQHAVQHPYDGKPVIIECSLINEEEQWEYSLEWYKKPKQPVFTLDLHPSTDAESSLVAIAQYNQSGNMPGQTGRESKLTISVESADGVLHSASVHQGMYVESLQTKVTVPYSLKKEIKITLTYINYGKLVYKNTYTVAVKQYAKDEYWNISIVTNDAQAQYLDLGTADKINPPLQVSKIRLNTMFGKNLVARATQSVAKVLDWETQLLPEPSLDDPKATVEMDLHGANALYLRELFLHLPAMVAMRLTEQGQFEEAEDWYLSYLFNPYRHEADEHGRPAPWCTRPLAHVGTLRSVLRLGVDLISRVFVLSRHYQQAVYLSLLENWQQQGDHHYRQLTLSSLNQAWLCYQQALKVLGPLPESDTTSRWASVALDKLDSNDFRKPVNPRVRSLQATLESRLYNLRHGLTLDGKTLPPLDWNTERLDAFMPARGGISNAPRPYRSGQVALPHYRFRQLLPLAKAAAQQLSDFGRHYMKLMEDEFNTTLSVQLKEHDIKIADFAIRLQKELVDNARAKITILQLNHAKASAHKDHLNRLIDVGRSPMEEAATSMTWISNASKVMSVPFESVAAAGEAALPTIYGMAVGGNDPFAPLRATSIGLKTIADALGLVSNELATQAGYERRAVGWAFDKNQVEWDLKILDQELVEAKGELAATKLGLAQQQQDRQNLQEAYISMTTGFTIIPIYNWMVVRQGQIYGVAYDAVRSLCATLEEAWRQEIGDYRRGSFFDTTVWSENYKGMLIGESLLVDLQQMENEYLLKNERRLTNRKTFSLKKLFGTSEWEQLLKRDDKRVDPLSLKFAFKASHFDRNFPGQYLRQLKYVSVTISLKGKESISELSATLVQTGSTLLLEDKDDAASSLYPEPKASSGLGSNDKTLIAKAGQDPQLVLRNPSMRQQIALSSAIAEDGLGYEPGTWVYELMFHDGRYLPFEGTGAISEWTLDILGDEALLKDPTIIEDISINMVYTAKAGSDSFTQHVKKLLKEMK
ncbi:MULTISPECIES: neuraminidase-like domain-containing protein [Pseudomonas]|uniref:Virulence plasmid A protein n=1 Tax=Pseudomonas quercus TaxID=2722792 RepID=A0ABX0YII8_9PSED|nr:MULTISPECIES: neuraminidase-like domain-containing protein [Pseudomonas]MBF7144884.1 hypothetical protein [Pseudomonas sp. LY10J]NJP01991.1 hypothetical protein [Pseudomonas quercus]